MDTFIYKAIACIMSEDEIVKPIMYLGSEAVIEFKHKLATDLKPYICEDLTACLVHIKMMDTLPVPLTEYKYSDYMQVEPAIVRFALEKLSLVECFDNRELEKQYCNSLFEYLAAFNKETESHLLYLETMRIREIQHSVDRTGKAKRPRFSF